jgi:hypothetical protein
MLNFPNLYFNVAAITEDPPCSAFVLFPWRPGAAEA